LKNSGPGADGRGGRRIWACVSAGQAARIKIQLRIEIVLDPRRATSYHRYTVACQHILEINFPVVQNSAQQQSGLEETAILRFTASLLGGA
jgi:hypothetical protein